MALSPAGDDFFSLSNDGGCLDAEPRFFLLLANDDVERDLRCGELKSNSISLSDADVDLFNVESDGFGALRVDFFFLIDGNSNSLSLSLSDAAKDFFAVGFESLRADFFLLIDGVGNSLSLSDAAEDSFAAGFESFSSSLSSSVSVSLLDNAAMEGGRNDGLFGE